ncbi:MAG: hypothetical protein HY042_08245 [Spirochaetia bacterium]|nr:hypothetical protein [Spirochaetia bacterium]
MRGRLEICAASLLFLYTGGIGLAAENAPSFSTPFVFAGLNAARKGSGGGSALPAWQVDQYVGLQSPADPTWDQAASSGPMTSRVELSVLAFLARRAPAKGSSTESVGMAPGNNLYVGMVSTSAYAMRFLVGRVGAEQRTSDAILFPHGALTGIHLISGSEESGFLRISVHESSLAGTFQSSEPGTPPRRMLDAARAPRSEPGLDLVLFGKRGMLRGVLRYGQESRESPNVIRASRDEINVLQAALALGPDEIAPPWFLTMSLEKASGSFQSGYRDDAGGYRRRVDGTALTTSAGVRLGDFTLGTTGYLPEPASVSKGSRPSARESSGFAAFGDSVLTESSLDTVLGFAPFPTFSPGAAGVTTTRSPAVFQSHAWVLRSYAGYSGDSLRGAVEYILFRPVRAGTGGAKKPGPDTSLPAFAEVALRLTLSTKGTSGLSMRYARITRRMPDIRRPELAGESLSIQANYSF